MNFFIVKYYYNLIELFSIWIYFKMQFIPVKQSWIFSSSLVFCITWSFRRYSNMLICCSWNISYYYQCWKQLCCLIILWFFDKKKVVRAVHTSRHLSQSSGDLPKSLSPTRGGVSHHADVIAHVSEVLRQCDTCSHTRHVMKIKASTYIFS